MPLEDAQYIDQLNPLWPLGTDGLNQSDDQHRVIKQAVQQSFPNIAGEVTANQDDLNTIAGAATTGSAMGLIPVGTRIEGYYAVAPNGYLLCDGSAIDPQYTALIAIVGPNTPDERGRFSRGWDASNAPLTQQSGGIPNITGTISFDPTRGNVTAAAGAFSRSGSGQNASSGSGGSPGTVVTFNSSASIPATPDVRPDNTAVLVCIKW
jgi:hypothetical protein